MLKATCLKTGRKINDCAVVQHKMFTELAKTKGLFFWGNTIWFIIVHTPKRVEF